MSLQNSANTTVLDILAEAIDRSATDFNQNDRIGPAAIIWPDKTRTWSNIVGRLKERIPIVTLGPLDVESLEGPAYWIRCVVQQTIDVGITPGVVPVVYLPGWSASELRDVQHCPEEIQVLAGLQFRRSEEHTSELQSPE